MPQTTVYRRPAPEQPSLILDADGSTINGSHLPLLVRAGATTVLLGPRAYRNILPAPLNGYRQVHYQGLLWRQVDGLPDTIGLVLGAREELIAIIIRMGTD